MASLSLTNDRSKAIGGAAISIIGLLFVIFNQIFKWLNFMPVFIWAMIAAVIILLIIALGWNLNGKWYGAMIDDRNRVSLSRMQIILWTVIALSAYLTIAIMRSAPNALGTPTEQELADCKANHVKEIAGVEDVAKWRAENPQLAKEADQKASELCVPQPLQITFPEELLLAMGISTASFAGSSLVKSIKRNKHTLGLISDLKDKAIKAKTDLDAKEATLNDISIQLGKATRDKIENDQKIAATTDEEALKPLQSQAVMINQAILALNEKLTKAQEEYDTAKKTYQEIKNKADVATKENEGLLKVNESSKQASLADMFQGDEIGNYNLIDLSKVQMFFFTVVIIMAYAVALTTLLQQSGVIYNPLGVDLPQFSSSLNTLLGISHAGYLGVKSIDQTKTAST